MPDLAASGTIQAQRTLGVPRLLTVREVAERLRVCRATVYRLVAQRRIPALRVSSGAVRILGCSLVVLDFGEASPVVALLPGAAIRRAVTGLFFGCVGALIAVSRVGKVSGAHLNPVVTLAFWLEGRMRGSVAAGYVLAQMIGGTLGALPLRLWGAMGASVAYGATTPGSADPWVAAVGEVGATFCLVAGLILFLGHARLRGYTPSSSRFSTRSSCGRRHRSPAPAPTRRGASDRGS